MIIVVSPFAFNLHLLWGEYVFNEGSFLSLPSLQKRYEYRRAWLIVVGILVCVHISSSEFGSWMVMGVLLCKCSVLDLFFFATCNPGDGCLIPAPYFPAFDNDMSIRVSCCAMKFMMWLLLLSSKLKGDVMLQNEVIPIPVQPTDTRTYIPTFQEMEEAVRVAEAKGIHARMLLVTNPGNPLGTLYPEATLKVMY